MALHGSTNRHLGTSPVGAVMTEGGSLDLALDQVGIFTKNPLKTTDSGLKALASFDGIDKDREILSVLFGNGKDSQKNRRTFDFTLRDVKKVGIAHPQRKEMSVDYWRVGWDGISDDTSLKFYHGQTIEFSMGISGVAVSFFNSLPDYTVKTSVTIPNVVNNLPCGNVGSICSPVDCREHTLTIVKNLNEYTLPTGQKLKQFFDIYPIFSKPKQYEVGEVYKQWKLKYCGHTGYDELAKVAAQYPGVKIKRDGNNDFILTAKEDYEPAPYKQTFASILKGCEECPTGYTLIEKGYAYVVSLADVGVDHSDTVAGLPNAIADTAVRTGGEYGRGNYIVLTTEPLTAEDMETFVTENPDSTILFVGTKEEFCENKDEVTHEWEELGGFSNTCHTYRILIADDCKGDKLKELQARYPNLEITKIESKNCFSIYETKVYTTTSCTKGCNEEIIEEIYASEAPIKFGLNNYWFLHSEVQDAEDVLCGFEIRAKPIVFSGSDCAYDDLPFIMTSTRITTLAGGYPTDYSINGIVPDGLWAIRQISRAQDLDNLGGNLRGWEKRGNYYFEDTPPYDSKISRELTGTHTRLKNLVQYSDLYFTIERKKHVSYEARSYETITYHVLVPYGRTAQIEELFKKFAGSANVPFETK